MAVGGGRRSGGVGGAGGAGGAGAAVMDEAGGDATRSASPPLLRASSARIAGRRDARSAGVAGRAGGHEAVERRADLAVELLEGRAVGCEVAAERILDAARLLPVA